MLWTLDDSHVFHQKAIINGHSRKYILSLTRNRLPPQFQSHSTDIGRLWLSDDKDDFMSTTLELILIPRNYFHANRHVYSMKWKHRQNKQVFFNIYGMSKRSDLLTIKPCTQYTSDRKAIWTRNKCHESILLRTSLTQQKVYVSVYAFAKLY